MIRTLLLDLASDEAKAAALEGRLLPAAGTGDSAQALKEEMEMALEQAAKASAVETY